MPQRVNSTGMKTGTGRNSYENKVYNSPLGLRGDSWRSPSFRLLEEFFQQLPFVLPHLSVRKTQAGDGSAVRLDIFFPGGTHKEMIRAGGAEQTLENTDRDIVDREDQVITHLQRIGNGFPRTEDTAALIDRKGCRRNAVGTRTGPGAVYTEGKTRTGPRIILRKKRKQARCR